MRKLQDIDISEQEISEYCRRHHIRKLSFFGSMLREDFRIDSDIDVLVEFEPGHVPGYFKLFDLEQELSGMLNGRKVDLRTPEELSAHFKDRVMEDAEVYYGKG